MIRKGCPLHQRQSAIRHFLWYASISILIVPIDKRVKLTAILWLHLRVFVANLRLWKSDVLIKYFSRIWLIYHTQNTGPSYISTSSWCKFMTTYSGKRRIYNNNRNRDRKLWERSISFYLIKYYNKWTKFQFWNATKYTSVDQ